MAKLAYHSVKACILERQVFHVTFMKIYIQVNFFEFSRARFIRTGVNSAPVTKAPHRAAVKATTPVSQATSKTLLLALISANLTGRGAAVPVKFSTEAKSDHADLAFGFI